MRRRARATPMKRYGHPGGTGRLDWFRYTAFGPPHLPLFPEPDDDDGTDPPPHDDDPEETP